VVLQQFEYKGGSSKSICRVLVAIVSVGKEREHNVKAAENCLKFPSGKSMLASVCHVFWTASSVLPTPDLHVELLMHL